MNLDQFCQVALLPQGQFQAFLRADSAQRHQLLARLFRTGRFERVESWLRDHRLALRRESEVHLAGVADLVSRLSEAAGAVVPDEHRRRAGVVGRRLADGPGPRHCVTRQRSALPTTSTAAESAQVDEHARPREPGRRP